MFNEEDPFENPFLDQFRTVASPATQEEYEEISDWVTLVQHPGYPRFIAKLEETCNELVGAIVMGDTTATRDEFALRLKAFKHVIAILKETPKELAIKALDRARN